MLVQEEKESRGLQAADDPEHTFRTQLAQNKLLLSLAARWDDDHSALPDPPGGCDNRMTELWVHTQRIQ